jgi:ABC-type polysaccharide/polyol phosphate export permease
MDIQDYRLIREQRPASRPAGPDPALAMLPVFVVLTIAAGFGVGLLLSAPNVKYRDIRYAIPSLCNSGYLSRPSYTR